MLLTGCAQRENRSRADSMQTYMARQRSNKAPAKATEQEVRVGPDGDVTLYDIIATKNNAILVHLASRFLRKYSIYSDLLFKAG